jgi:hypothetical protein
MKIGVIADIHDNIDNLQKAFAILKRERVAKVLFAGDLSAPFTISYFKQLGVPVLAVFGNNEGDHLGIIRKIAELKLDFRYAPKQGIMWDLTIAGKRIALYHGHQEEITNCIMAANLYDIVVTGHTHYSQLKTVGKTLWLNPGCICGYVGLEQKPVKPTFATINLETNKVDLITLNDE